MSGRVQSTAQQNGRTRVGEPAAHKLGAASATPMLPTSPELEERGRRGGRARSANTSGGVEQLGLGRAELLVGQNPRLMQLSELLEPRDRVDGFARRSGRRWRRRLLLLLLFPLLLFLLRPPAFLAAAHAVGHGGS